MINTTTIFCAAIINKLCGTLREFDAGIMNKLLKVLKISLTIILAGMLIPALLAIIFSGFKVNLISIVNFEFFTGLMIALVGGVMIVAGYSRFKKKVLKTPVGHEIEVDKDKEKEQINWSYLLFLSGLAITLAAIAVGEVF